MSNAMRQWLDQSTREQAEKLAKMAKTSLGTLRQIAGGYRTCGEARTTPEMARNLEMASRKLKESPLIRREDLCPACAQCEYLNQTKGEKNGR